MTNAARYRRAALRIGAPRARSLVGVRIEARARQGVNAREVTS